MRETSRALIPTWNLSIDLSNTALCITTCPAKTVLVHLDWAPPADAGTGRQEVQWQNGRLAVQACENLV